MDALEASLNDITDEEVLRSHRQYIEWAKLKINWINPMVGKKDAIFGYKYEK